ncbi:LOG family protein [Candidatus Woesearchaeota archaeon]|nr:LOG family protein [Candidatus Woesearchaeota archaeon]
MNIAVCGSAVGPDKIILEKAEAIGSFLAKQGFTLVTGGTTGYPHAALVGALQENGKALCFSPAKDRREHLDDWKMPLEPKAEYVFTGHGIPGRNQDIIEAADKVVIIGGQIGTLNEFSIAFVMKKPVFVLKDSGGVSSMLEEISAICKRDNEKVIYFSRIEELPEILKL